VSREKNSDERIWFYAAYRSNSEIIKDQYSVACHPTCYIGFINRRFMRFVTPAMPPEIDQYELMFISQGLDMAGGGLDRMPGRGNRRDIDMLSDNCN
jgi:hypothetical protein